MDINWLSSDCVNNDRSTFPSTSYNISDKFIWGVSSVKDFILGSEINHLCVCYCPPVRGVCTNYEVVDSQPQTVTPSKPSLCM